MDTFRNNLKQHLQAAFMLELKKSANGVRCLMSFKDTFARLRKEKGLLQTQVAEKLGISVGQVKKYEKGVSTPSLSVLGKIATLFGVSTDVFVFDTGKGVAGEKLEPELLRRFEMVSHLPDRERDALLLVIDSILARQKLREVIGV